MSTKIRISDELSLPIEAVTETFCILAMRGKGKTHTASIMAEEMLEAGVPIVIYDPVGVWWGLKSSKDGRGKGFPIAIFGGDHADLPLESGAGETIARSIVDNRYPAILDLSHMRKGQTVTFMADFLESLYFNNRKAVHIFLDEVQSLAPQMIRQMGGDAPRCLGAVEDVIQRGRARGLGVTAISQRPASVNTNVRNLCSTLIAMGMSGKHDIKAIQEWVEVHSTEEKAAEMVKALPTLPRGEGYVWSPSAFEIFKRVCFRDRSTFDSSRTPKVGEAVKAPKEMAAPDLEKLGEAIRATAEKAKANDPANLKKRISELEKQIAAKPAGPWPTEKTKIVEKPVIKDAQLAKAIKLAEKLDASTEKTTNLAGALQQAVIDIHKTLAPLLIAQPIKSASINRGNYPQITTINTNARPPTPVARVAAPAAGNGAGDARLGKCERSILSALAQYPAGRSKQQIAVLAGYAVNGGGFGNSLGKLRSLGCVVDNAGSIAITQTGLEMLGEYTPLPTGSALLQHWLSQLGKCEREILLVLAGASGAAMSKAEIAAACPGGYAPDGGGFGNALGRLRTLELISGRGDAIAANENLFD